MNGSGVAGAPRPVTPIGIASALLDSVVDRVGERLAASDPDVAADLDRARELIGGLDDYVARCTSPLSDDLAALEQRTRSEAWDVSGGLEQEMLSGEVEGAFLRMLVAITGARRILEIGMFTGYSALAMAQALPDGGRLVACEIDERAAAIATAAFGTSAGGDRIDVRMGPAAETLRALGSAGDQFDLVFLDADKVGYAEYVRAVLDLDLLTDGGVLCVDNTLMQGDPWAGAEADRSANGTAIAVFNAAVAADRRVEQVLVPLRDGVTLVRRVS